MADLKKLIDQTIIIEGLLRNIEAHNSEQTSEYTALLSVKFEEFQEMYYNTFPPVEAFAESHPEVQAEVVEVVEMDEIFTHQSDCPTPVPPPINSRPSQQPYQPAPMPSQQPFQPRPIPVQQPFQPRPIPSQQPFQPRPISSQQPFQPQQVPSQKPYQSMHTGMPGVTPQPRIDEALSRRKAENLSKAFTINDKYRFGQELFYGNNELMNEQIKAAQLFNNYQQAYDLFVSGNNWNPENPLVKEFMGIVSRHFQQS